MATLLFTKRDQIDLVDSEVKDSLLLSVYIYEEGKREIKTEPNLLESGNNISLDSFHKNQPSQERIEREFLGSAVAPK